MTESPGDKIRKYRRVQKPRMAQETLAGQVGITKASMSRIESGVMPLTVELAQKISEATGIPFRELRPDLAKLVEADSVPAEAVT